MRSCGPSPRRAAMASSTSTALPTARPSGVSMLVTRALVRTPFSSPSLTMMRARLRAFSLSCMKAPVPVLTSRTSAPVPSAIFLDMIELAISGIDSTVPVTSRSAYSFLSAGARPPPAAAITAPTVPSAVISSSLLRLARQPRDRLQLVQGPAGVPEAAPGKLGHRRAAACHERSEHQRHLVAHAARGVLVHRGPGETGEVKTLAGRDHLRRPGPELACRRAR